MNNELRSKNKLVKWLIGLIVLAGVGYGLYYLKVKNSNIKTITQNTSTAEWKTYENKDYGFSFKYPEDWKYNIQYEIPDPEMKLAVSEFENGETFLRVRVINSDIKEQLNVYEKIFGNFEKVIIDNIDSYDSGPRFGNDGSTREILIPAGKETISIGADILTDETTFDQILSTFKFTK